MFPDVITSSHIAHHILSVLFSKDSFDQSAKTLTQAILLLISLLRKTMDAESSSLMATKAQEKRSLEEIPLDALTKIMGFVGIHSAIDVTKCKFV